MEKCVAVVRGGIERRVYGALLSALGPGLALLDRSHATHQRGLCFHWNQELVEKRGAGLLHGLGFLLDGVQLAHDGHGSWLVHAGALHGAIHRILGLVSR